MNHTSASLVTAGFLRLSWQGPELVPMTRMMEMAPFSDCWDELEKAPYSTLGEGPVRDLPWRMVEEGPPLKVLT